jgi:transposase
MVGRACVECCMSRPIGTAAELERRRRHAVRLIQQGEPRVTVARILSIHYKTLGRWLRLARRPDGLDAKPQTGPRPGLSDDQLRQLEQLLLQGSKEHGWRNQLWTAPRVAVVIRRHFGRDYHPEHVRKILKRRLHWTSQKPRRKARERNDKEVERWLDDDYPRLVRDAYRRQAHLVFLDESGFFLTPTVRRTLAPRGHTPVLDAWDRRDKLSAISAITISPAAGRPNLYFRLSRQNLTGADVVQFLADLRRRLGPLTVVWDRGQIHNKCVVVKVWLARHPDVVAEDFPGYVPDLNPDEGVWGWTKYGRLSNLAADDLDWLWEYVWEELEGAKGQPDLLRAFIRETGLPGVLRVA